MVRGAYVWVSAADLDRHAAALCVDVRQLAYVEARNAFLEGALPYLLAAKPWGDRTLGRQQQHNRERQDPFPKYHEGGQSLDCMLFQDLLEDCRNGR